jgi:uncharacterized protein (DUF2235 family)
MKHLIHLIDGTWMFPLKKSLDPVFTNIHKINNFLGYFDRGNKNPQIIHYYRGLGSGHRLTKYMAGAAGIGIWDDIEEVYLNICSNYRSLDPNDPDEIYLIGYSRGAVVARVVAGLVNIGLLDSDFMDYFHHLKRIYLYAAAKSNRRKLSIDDERDYSESTVTVEGKFQKTEVRIKFLGLFDSILGGSGASRRAQSLNLENSSPAVNVDYTLHLISADERRKIFRPSVFAHKSDRGLLEQIWVPGNHSDIGGGPGSSALSRISLLTMCDRISEHTSLRINFNRELEKVNTQERPKFEISTQPLLLSRALSPTYYWLKKRKITGANIHRHEIMRVLQKHEIPIDQRRTRYQNNSLSELTEASTFLSGWPGGTPRWLK